MIKNQGGQINIDVRTVDVLEAAVMSNGEDRSNLGTKTDAWRLGYTCRESQPRLHLNFFHFYNPA